MHLQKRGLSFASLWLICDWSHHSKFWTLANSFSSAKQVHSCSECDGSSATTSNRGHCGPRATAKLVLLFSLLSHRVNDSTLGNCSESSRRRQPEEKRQRDKPNTERDGCTDESVDHIFTTVHDLCDFFVFVSLPLCRFGVFVQFSITKQLRRCRYASVASVSRVESWLYLGRSLGVYGLCYFPTFLTSRTRNALLRATVWPRNSTLGGIELVFYTTQLEPLPDALTTWCVFKSPHFTTRMYGTRCSYFEPNIAPYRHTH